MKKVTLQVDPLSMTDTEIVDWLERLFKSNSGMWPLVAIQTIPSQAAVSAVNKHHGNEAGLVIAPTLRKAVSKCLLRALSDMLDRAALRDSRKKGRGK